MARLSPKDCAHRIYRDTRFKKDKTPLKTYFSATFTTRGRTVSRAGYYLQMGIGEDMGIFGGIWCPDSKLLKRLRSDIVASPEEFRSTFENKRVLEAFPDWVGTKLKTVPKGYDRNDPNADLLRLVDIGRFHPADETFFCSPDWPEKTAELMSLLKPLCDFINFTIDEG